MAFSGLGPHRPALLRMPVNSKPLPGDAEREQTQGTQNSPPNPTHTLPCEQTTVVEEHISGGQSFYPEVHRLLKPKSLESGESHRERAGGVGDLRAALWLTSKYA